MERLIVLMTMPAKSFRERSIFCAGSARYRLPLPLRPDQPYADSLRLADDVMKCPKPGTLRSLRLL
jgi:hypothetical protein